MSAHLSATYQFSSYYAADKHSRGASPSIRNKLALSRRHSSYGFDSQSGQCSNTPKQSAQEPNLRCLLTRQYSHNSQMDSDYTPNEKDILEAAAAASVASQNSHRDQIRRWSSNNSDGAANKRTQYSDIHTENTIASLTTTNIIQKLQTYKTACVSFIGLKKEAEDQDEEQEEELTVHDMAEKIVADDIQFAKLQRALRESGRAKTSMGVTQLLHQCAKERIDDMRRNSLDVEFVSRDLIEKKTNLCRRPVSVASGLSQMRVWNGAREEETNFSTRNSNRPTRWSMAMSNQASTFRRNLSGLNSNGTRISSSLSNQTFVASPPTNHSIYGNSFHTSLAQGIQELFEMNSFSSKPENDCDKSAVKVSQHYEENAYCSDFELHEDDDSQSFLSWPTSEYT